MMSTPVLKEKTLDLMADRLHKHGYIVLLSSLNEKLLKDLQYLVQTLPLENWKQAGIGRQQNHQENLSIRSDKTHWISAKNSVESNFLDYIEMMRIGLNQRLYLGLFEYEGHFSIYGKGTYYQKHLDALKGQGNRVLSQILYLNSDWKKHDSGELVLYSEKGGARLQTIAPHLGTLVLFLSEQFPHEILKTNRTRYSLAGWFRMKP